ncbi:MAG: dTDP-4-dehydrorhamnose reductase [Flavobacteriales bacterium]|nr:dTDP-4-dehydrorhamnose reductase [Flavobacteriales bacterium]
MRRVIITGAQGQLGKRLVQEAGRRDQWEVRAFGREDLDITSQAAVDQAIEQWHPDVVINAAAYTAVDQAEEDEESAFAVNGIGPGFLASTCARKGVNFIHVSTDYVFDGESSRPYLPEDPTNPVGVYGVSKRLGEKAVSRGYQEVASGSKHWIFRAAWLYDSTGKNFLTTMLRLAEKGQALRVVSDQLGAPTAAGPLASMLMDCAENPDVLDAGIWHYGTVGPTSWFDFARAIFQLTDKDVEVNPCSTADYPTRAKRPAYSYLDPYPLMRKWSKEPVPWELQLKECLDEKAEL